MLKMQSYDSPFRTLLEWTPCKPMLMGILQLSDNVHRSMEDHLPEAIHGPSQRYKRSLTRANKHDLMDCVSWQGKDQLTSREDTADIQSSLYLQLPEDEQSLLFLLLGRLACTAMSGWDQDLSTMPNCPDCNDSNAQQKHSKVPDAPDITIVSDTLVDLIKLLRSSKSRKPRVAAMQALPRVLRHTADKEYLDLSSSYLGQHCLASLRSSLRELRIGAR